MKSKMIMSIDDLYLLMILNDKDDIKEYVVCSNYDPSLPFGSQWDWGHYFSSLKPAVEYISRG